MKRENPGRGNGTGFASHRANVTVNRNGIHAKRPTLSAFFDPNHTIIVRRVGGLFEVVIEPEHPSHGVETFVTWRDARGCASGIRIVNRWQIIDQTVEAEHG